MADIKDKLGKLLANRSLVMGSEWRKERDALQARREAGEYEIDKLVPGQVVEDENGGFFLYAQDFPLDTPHGPLPLGAVLESTPEHIALSACDSELEDFDPRSAIFMDCETTGLSGGTGTMAFLVGIGYFTETGFRLEQCFMRDYDDEEPMLRYLDGLFRNAATIVTFNGKSFDVPLLRTRFISNRIPFRLDGAVHYDLVHAARRLWRLRLKDCSLTNIERRVMGLERHGDVPGADIPQIWFDYLRTRDACDVKRVFYHHRMDILSLVTMTAMLASCLGAAPEEEIDFVEDRLSIVRLHYRQKHFDVAAQHARRLLESETDDYVRRECLELMGYAFKRLEDWDRMVEAWSLMLRDYPDALLARAELAKYHEHRSKNLNEACRICEETLQLFGVRESSGPGEDLESLQSEDFQHRLERLRRKLSRGGVKVDPEGDQGLL